MPGAFDFVHRTRVVFGPGTLGRLGELAAGLGFRRTLLASDPGLGRTGHVERAATLLRDAGVEVFGFDGFGPNPDTEMVAAGADVARGHAIDSLVGLGGGSSLDCAKAISFLASNGGSMSDYLGYAKARRPLLPMIGVPTTAGTGSEAQSYALISDARSHVKMACGDPGAAFRVAVLDPELTLTQPAAVTASAGFDAIAHAVETYVSTARNALSESFAREAWRLLEPAYPAVLRDAGELQARSAMLLGAHYAGVAIEASMLGATHACANPLTARYGAEHGVAIAVMLPHVVRWNAARAGERYAELLQLCGRDAGADPAGRLAALLESLAAAGGLPRRLRELGAPDADLVRLADDAAAQWTGRFNPRPFDAAGALELYRCAY